MFDRVRGLAAALLLGLLAAGCAQEGKLIDVPLGVRGVAYDQIAVADTSTVLGFRTRSSRCRSRREHVRDEPLSSSSRASAAEPGVCHPADRALQRRRPCVNGGNVEGYDDHADRQRARGARHSIPFRGREHEGPDFRSSPTPRCTWRCLDHALPRSGRGPHDRRGGRRRDGRARQPVDRGGGTGRSGSATTDGLGLATFDVASTVPVGVNAFRYRVT